MKNMDQAAASAPVKVGDILPDFVVDTAFQEGIHLSQLTEGKPAMLLLLRYLGCPLCQLDLHELHVGMDKIRAVGGRLVVVLQSSRETMAAELGTPGALAYPIICDPEKKLYQALDVHAAQSEAELLGPGFPEKLTRIQAMGYTHGAYEGDELQLPAAFAMDENRELTYVHYGRSADDTPSAEQIAELLRK